MSRCSRWLPSAEWELEKRDAFIDAAKRMFPGSYEPFRGETPSVNDEVEAMERHLDSIEGEIRDAVSSGEQLPLDEAA
jgi:hypothetical protein